MLYDVNKAMNISKVIFFSIKLHENIEAEISASKKTVSKKAQGKQNGEMSTKKIHRVVKPYQANSIAQLFISNVLVITHNHMYQSCGLISINNLHQRMHKISHYENEKERELTRQSARYTQGTSPGELHVCSLTSKEENRSLFPPSPEARIIVKSSGDC